MQINLGQKGTQALQVTVLLRGTVPTTGNYAKSASMQTFLHTLKPFLKRPLSIHSKQTTRPDFNISTASSL